MKVTCDTAPPYFTLNETSLLSYNTAFKLSPPLRNEDDRLAVIEGIQDGTIDAIASDHRARSKDTKAQPFSAASVGASGIETLFLMTLELVHKKIIDLNKAISLLTINPANVLNMHKPSLEKNKQADFIIFDENCPDVIKQNNLKTSPSPFDCRKVKGKVLGTFINGKVAHMNQILEDKIIK
jgi:dihydroorotase